MSAPPRRTAPPPPPEEERGASANEQLLAACKTDNESLFDQAIKVLEDVNYADGRVDMIQMLMSEWATLNASTTILEPLLEHETCDVDLRNRLQGDTPLHIAVRQKWEGQKGLRVYLVMSLLEAGANTLHNEKPIDLLPASYPGSNPASVDPESDDEKIRAAIRTAEAEAALGDAGDVVDDDDLIDPNDIASDSD